MVCSERYLLPTGSQMILCIHSQHILLDMS